MPTFGFSAFLKLLSMRERPQRTALRDRLRPSRGGYDFHRSFRLRAQRFLAGRESMAEIFAGLHEISRDPERRSVQAALEQLALWRAANPGDLVEFDPVTFESPRGLFKVTFEPSLGVVIDGRATAIHTWNNAAPALAEREARAALALIWPLYEGRDGGPDDVAVLSVRPPLALHTLSAAPDQALLARRLVEQVEHLIEELRDELGVPVGPAEERPIT